MRRDASHMEELERQIEDSEIFRMSRSDAPETYQKLALVLVENLYRYVCEMNCRRYEDMGLEVVETTRSCLGSYCPEKGPFLHYFLHAIKLRAAKETAVRQKTASWGGVLLPEKLRVRLFQLETVARKMGRDPEDLVVLTTASRILDVPEDQLRALLEWKDRFAAAPEADLDSVSGSNQETPETLLLARQDLEHFLRKMEVRFLRCRPGQREVLTKLLTARIAVSAPEQISQCRGRAFFDGAFYEECLRKGRVPAAREIAAELGRKEESVSRTLRRFLETLQDEEPEASMPK